MGLEPVPELAEAFKLNDKCAYGWFQTLCEELAKLSMESSPFDPCMFVLRHPVTGKLSGALGVHVDDGIYGGDEYFHEHFKN